MQETDDANERKEKEETRRTVEGPWELTTGAPGDSGSWAAERGADAGGRRSSRGGGHSAVRRRPITRPHPDTAHHQRHQKVCPLRSSIHAGVGAAGRRWRSKGEEEVDDGSCGEV